MQTVSSSPNFHLVLLGQVGAGKSATGNTILGKKTFKSKKSLKGITKKLQIGEVNIDGLCVHVYDTPGFFSPGVQNEDIERKCQKVLNLDDSVPTVFLLVLSTDRYGDQEKKNTEIIERFLGDKHLQNTWILFTKGDELERDEVTIEEYMEDSEDLKDVVQTFHRRYQVFNNKIDKDDPINKKQVDELIRKIKSTILSIPANFLNQHRRNEQETDSLDIMSRQNQDVTQETETSQTEAEENAELEVNEADRVSDASDTEDLSSTDQTYPSANSAAAVQTTSSDEDDSLLSRRILLLGKTGVGKSATGNTILGSIVFKSRSDLNAVTKKSKKKHSEVNGRKVTVIDTPGFFDSKIPKEKLATEFGRCLHQSRKGVHALLLVFKYERFTEQEAEMLKRVEEVFGKEVTNHICIIFTHGDKCNYNNFKSSMKKNEVLSDVIQKCGGKYHIINNECMNKREQVTKLLRMIDTMLEKNGGQCYTNEMFTIANMGSWEYIRFRIRKFCLWAIEMLTGKKSDTNPEENIPLEVVPNKDSGGA